MRSETSQKPQPAKTSLTDKILAFCGSGRFGVREAIAAAQTAEQEAEKPEIKPAQLKKAA